MTKLAFFLAGLFIGAVIGVFTLAICSVDKSDFWKGEDDVEKS